MDISVARMVFSECASVRAKMENHADNAIRCTMKYKTKDGGHKKRETLALYL